MKTTLKKTTEEKVEVNGRKYLIKLYKNGPGHNYTLFHDADMGRTRPVWLKFSSGWSAGSQQDAIDSAMHDLRTIEV